MVNNGCSQFPSLSGSHNAKKGGRNHAILQSFDEQYVPFHRLPRETIGEIFVHCLPDFEDVHGSFQSANTAPLLLCNVSSSWRSVALSIPRLWSQLSIENMNTREHFEFTVAMVESWIARSGTLPLSLRLHTTSFNEGGRSLTKALLNTFFHYSSRWESVDIMLGSDDESVSFPVFGPTPLLRKFSYSGRSDRVPWPFVSSPLLSSFAWPFRCSTSSDSNIPWHQLTNITMENVNYGTSSHQVLDILQTCKMLVEFKVAIDDFEMLGVDQIQPVENRSLHTLHISVTESCSYLLESITLPGLTNFSLIADVDSLSPILARYILTELLHLFTRSKCKLKKLKFWNCEFNDAGILKCLKHDSCSSLTSLDISTAYEIPMFTDKVILALTDNDDVSEANNILLPHLSSLWLDKCVSASPGVLGFMVATRYLWRDKGDRLESFILLIRELDPQDAAFLKIVEKMGMDVDIATRPDGLSDSEEDLFDLEGLSDSEEDLSDADDS